MKIAHVVARFPPDVGGMGEVAWHEAQSLAKLGHQVTVFSLPPRNATPVSENFLRVVLRPLIPGGDAGWVPGLLGKLREFDIVHLHYPFYGGAEWVWLAHKLNKQKYVMTYHMQADPTVGYRKLIQSTYDTFLTRAILNDAQSILVVDKNYFFANTYLAKIPSEKIVEVSNGIDVTVFCPGSEPKPKTLLFVGNLMPVKGLDILLQSVCALPEVQLTVVGAGYEEVVYKKTVERLGLTNRVTFVGAVAHSELPRLYREAWATIVPSRAESFSLVTLESMACGTPVVASDVIGIRGKIENGVDGYFFAKDNAIDLKNKIEVVMRLSAEERKKMAERGSVKIKEKFSMESHMQQLMRIYQQVI